jgi:DUF4097 and DUF4098 domain-containing protein YvlB
MARLRVVSKSGNVDVFAEAGGGVSASGGVLVTEPDGTIVVNAGSKSLEVRCEPGSDVVVGTISGSIRLHGQFGAVRVATKSGKIEIDGATEIDARTASGSVRVDECTGACRAVVTSGSIRVGRAGSAWLAGVSGSLRVDEADSAEIKTVSGKVELGSTATGRVAIRSVSGTVEVSVPEGRAPEVHLKSIAGRMRNECPQGTDGEINVKTVSGTIRVECK